MAIEKRRTKSGRVQWVYRWKESGRYRAKVFDSKRDAEIFEGDIRRRRQLGSLGTLGRGRTTVRELHGQWCELHRRDLSPKSVSLAEGVWRTHVEPTLGNRRLSELDPQSIERWAHGLLDAGVGETSVEKCWLQLGAMMERATSWGWIERNPVRLARRPRKRGARRQPIVLSPSQVEAIRSRMGQRDAALVSVLAYAGLRPGEALALTWGDVGGGRIEVTKAVSMGEVRAPKTGRSRSVPIPVPLAQDFREWRIASGRPDDGVLVFPGPRGDVWGEPYRRAWTGRYFRPAAIAAKVDPGVRPYDLRASCASLLIRSGLDVVQVAARMGHSATMLLDTYAKVLREYEGQAPISIEDEIRRARGALPRRSAQGA